MKEFIEQITREAGKLAIDYFERDTLEINTKSGPLDFVTEADIAVSEFLVHKIHTTYPDHQIHSEEMEHDINPGAQYEWVIDPIDGTSNYSRHVPNWCIIIALLKDGVVEYGAVLDPLSDDFFFAQRGHGVFRNRKPVKVTAAGDIMRGHIYATYDVNIEHGERIKRFNRTFQDELGRRAPRRIGNMLGACYVACGSAELVALNAGRDHDYLAMTLLVEEAGGKVTDSEGNPWVRGRRDIVFSNGAIHDKVIEMMNE